MDRQTKPAEKRTFSLPPEQSRFIDRMVESGTFASSSEVVRAGLRALQERDAAIERWLREDVVPTYDRMLADPGRGVPVADVQERLRAKHLQRLKDEAP